MKKADRIWTLLLLLQTMVYAQPQEPRVGLVLSGGGAKALAHVGLLRVLEEEGVRPDFVAGTSMGAVIGALYAIGYTPDQIEREMYRVDWEAIVLNDRPRSSLSFLDKGSEERYLLSFPMRGWTPTLPDGINYGQRIINELDRLTIGTHDIRDFSEFPIPFACLATDLETGEAVVLDTGYLPDALRATSSFPSLYSPYEINGRLLVDGGLIENLPIQLLKTKDVDHIIGSDVQSISHSREELNSVFNVLDQISGFVNARNHRRDSAEALFIVRPDIPGAGVTTFEMMDSIFSAGYREASRYRAQIRAIGKPRTEIPLKPMHQRARRDSLFLNQVHIPPSELASFGLIKRKLGLRTGRESSDQDLVNGMNRLWGTQLYATADFKLLPSPGKEDAFDLHLRLKERRYLQQIRLGLHYDDDFQTAVLLNYTRRNLLFTNSKLSLDAAVGVNPRLWLEYTVDREFIPTVRLSFRSHRFKMPLYINRKLESEKVYLDYSLSAMLQSVAADRLLVAGGIQIEGVDLGTTISEVFPEAVYQNYVNYFALLELDLLDKGSFPSKGSSFKGNYRVITTTEEYRSGLEPTSVLGAELLQVVPLWEGSSMYLKGNLITTIGPDPDYQYAVFLGGLGQNYINQTLPFLGYRFMELVGRSAVAFGADINYQFIPKHYLVARANFGALETSFKELWNSQTLLDGYGLSYAYESALGPLQLTFMGSTNHAEIYTYVSLGHWF